MPNGFHAPPVTPLIVPRRSTFKAVGTALAFLTFASQASAQETYVFKDDAQLKAAMSEFAKRTLSDAPMPKGCELHVITVAGGEHLFDDKTFSAMNRVLAQVIDRQHVCKVQHYQLARDRANALFRGLSSRGEKALILNVTYIPLTQKVVAYAKLRDATDRLIGNSGRFDLPVTPVVVKPPETVAAIPEEETKLLTEVHFNPGSADVTYVGKQKIGEAADAIKKQKPREIRILGFTDTAGNAAANKAIAGARAANVARLLKQHGVHVPLVVEGKGEGGGPYSTPDGVSEPLNRCVGIIYVGPAAPQ